MAGEVTARSDVLSKAIRLVRGGHVAVSHVGGEEFWSVTVQGDTGTYIAGRSPEGRFCDCPAGQRHVMCSHYLAGEVVVTGFLEKERALS